MYLVGKGRQESIDVWDDSRILPDSDWRIEIESSLKSARAVILLISQDFIASDFIDKYELPALLEAAEREGATILPLLISPSSFENRKDLSRFQSINSPKETLLDIPHATQERYLLKLNQAVSVAFANFSRQTSQASKTKNVRILSIPFPPNRFFTGRDEALLNLYTNFKDGERIQALVGLGGIGKTQTAFEFAHRYHDNYSEVFWVRANTQESIVKDVVAIAELLDLKEKDAQDQGEAVAAVKQWLETNTGWLLILDNADELAIVEEYFLDRTSGHILLTTRAQNAGAIAMRNVLKKMTPQEGAFFLLKKTEILKKKETLDSISSEICIDAEALSKELDGIPLALDQAAAFMNQTGRNVKSYLQRYRTERALLLEDRDELTPNHPSVMVTFSLAFKKVADANPAAADILRVCAFLDSDSIPDEIFIEGAEELGDTLKALAGNYLGIAIAIGDARRFSLVEVDGENQTISLHRLIQAVLREEMAKEGIEELWAERAIRAVSSIFPIPDFENWPTCSRLINHVQALVKIVEQYRFEFKSVSTLLHETGLYLKQRAQFAEAENLYRRSLAISEKSLGPDHPDVAARLNSLALLLKDTNRMAEAEPLIRRALKIDEKSLSPFHPDVAARLNSLALLLNDTNRMAEAEPLYRRALEIDEKSLGHFHPAVAGDLNNLASLLQDTNRMAEAEPLLRRALEIDEKSFGPDHPDVAARLTNLASLLQDTNRMAEAEPLLRRALHISEKSLGPLHPDVAAPLTNLAGLLNDTNRMAEAEPLYRRALRIIEKSLGADHPDVATPLNNLADLLKTTNRMAEAEPLYRRALLIIENSMGADHPNIATPLNNLAGLLKATNRMAEAESLYRRALHIIEKSLGSDHPNVATRLNNLALLLKDTNRMAEAEPLLRRALHIIEKSLGSDHPNVAIGLHNLALLLKDTNRMAEAEPLYRRALEIDEKSLGSLHPAVAIDLHNLALLLKDTNRMAEAEPLYRRALEIDEKYLGVDHPDVAIGLHNLASLLKATNRMAEAEPLYRRALEIDEKSLGLDHPDVAIRLNNLALLLKATNRIAEAESLYRRALEIAEKSRGHDHPQTITIQQNLVRLLHTLDRAHEAKNLKDRIASGREGD
jgi:tetratricopeptide (TPR) repeat protein